MAKINLLIQWLLIFGSQFVRGGEVEVAAKESANKKQTQRIFINPRVGVNYIDPVLHHYYTVVVDEEDLLFVKKLVHMEHASRRVHVHLVGAMAKYKSLVMELGYRYVELALDHTPDP